MFCLVNIISCTKAQKQTEMSVNKGNSVALVELFTSQGCSSCPPADELLANLIKEYNDNQQVIAISFHVDYWDRLGWKDPFSQRVFTQRQRNYVDKLDLRSAYTPQMVVNGKYEFVGSDKSALQSALKKAQDDFSKVSVKNLMAKASNDAITVSYEIDGKTDEDQVFLCLISPKEVTSIKRGENGGRILTNTNVVLQMSEGLNNSKGTYDFKVPESKKKDLAIVAFVSEKNSMAVKAAYMTKLE